MFINNQLLSLLVPIASITWIIFGIIQYKTKQISKIQLILFFLSGLFICILAAYRDGYGFSENSVISLTSIESTLLSILGVVIVLSTLVGLLSSSSIRFKLFIGMCLLFILKFSFVEMIVRGLI